MKKKIKDLTPEENMICANPQSKSLTLKECIERLETLFKAYQKDSEFNYQLSVYDSAFNALKRFLTWKPIEEYIPGKHDWVIVQFEEKGSGFRGIPKIVEFRKMKWHTQEEDKTMEHYLNETCRAISFVDLPLQYLESEVEIDE